MYPQRECGPRIAELRIMYFAHYTEAPMPTAEIIFEEEEDRTKCTRLGTIAEQTEGGRDKPRPRDIVYIYYIEYICMYIVSLGMVTVTNNSFCWVTDFFNNFFITNYPKGNCKFFFCVVNKIIVLEKMSKLIRFKSLLDC